MWLTIRLFLTDVTAFDIYKDIWFLSIGTANELNTSIGTLLWPWLLQVTVTPRLYVPFNPVSKYNTSAKVH